jgi:hypothetical protein
MEGHASRCHAAAPVLAPHDACDARALCGLCPLASAPRLPLRRGAAATPGRGEMRGRACRGGGRRSRQRFGQQSHAPRPALAAPGTHLRCPGLAGIQAHAQAARRAPDALEPSRIEPTPAPAPRRPRHPSESPAAALPPRPTAPGCGTAPYPGRGVITFRHTASWRSRFPVRTLHATTQPSHPTARLWALMRASRGKFLSQCPRRHAHLTRSAGDGVGNQGTCLGPLAGWADDEIACTPKYARSGRQWLTRARESVVNAGCDAAAASRGWGRAGPVRN